MKKIFSIITVCVICIFSFTACNQSTKEFSDVELVKWGEADRKVHYSLEELEKDCDIAVVGTFVGDSTQDITYQYSDDFGKEIILGVKSFNTIEVKQVLMGDINVGDTLNVSQRYGVVDDRLITMSELTPMIKGDTWIFFLYNNYDSGIYVCCGDSDGRYPLPNSVNKTLAVTNYSNLGVYDERDFKSGIYSEILEKYDI